MRAARAARGTRIARDKSTEDSAALATDVLAQLSAPESGGSAAEIMAAGAVAVDSYLLTTGIVDVEDVIEPGLLPPVSMETAIKAEESISGEKELLDKHFFDVPRAVFAFYESFSDVDIPLYTFSEERCVKHEEFVKRLSAEVARVMQNCMALQYSG